MSTKSESDSEKVEDFISDSFRNNSAMGKLAGFAKSGLRSVRNGVAAARDNLQAMLTPRRTSKQAQSDHNSDATITTDDATIDNGLECSPMNESDDELLTQPGAQPPLQKPQPQQQQATAPTGSPPVKRQSELTKQIAGGFKLVSNAKMAQRPKPAAPPMPKELVLAAAAVAAKLPNKGPSTPSTRPLSVPIPTGAMAAALNTTEARWLRIQHELTAGAGIKALTREEVELDDGTVVEGERVTIYYGDGPQNTVVKRASPRWVDALNALKDSGSASHSGAASAGAVTNHRSARIRGFTRPHFFCPDAKDGNGRVQCFPGKAPFPTLTPEGLRDVLAIEIVPAHELNAMLMSVQLPDHAEYGEAVAQFFRDKFPSDGAVVAADAAAAANETKTWDQHKRTDADVDAAIANLGKQNFKLIRELKPESHRAWRVLCAEAFGEYKADQSPEQGLVLIRRLCTLVLLHGRTLVGSHNSARRKHHAAAQLAGNVCDQTEASLKQQRQLQQQQQQAPQKKQDEARQLAQIMRLITQGKMRDASKAMQRLGIPPPERKPIDQVVSDLEKLHPDGDPPPNIVPDASLFSTAVVPVDAVRAAVKRMCNEASPGPSGWTSELLHVALGDATFADAFRQLVIDMCNGALHPHAELLLNCSNIIGIPKDKGGSRPIAMGETFIKVAADIAIQRSENQLRDYFRGTQCGVMFPGGAEHIIHMFREFLVSGLKPGGSFAGALRVVLLFDAKNAFNMPHRDKMLQALYDAGLYSLIGVFKTAYAQHAKMYVVGSQGEHIIMSKCGARQGTVDGSVNFSVLLQPIINEINNNHEGAFAASYLDDTTNGNDDVPAAHRSAVAYDSYLRSHGAELQPTKCELVMPGLVTPGQTYEQYKQRVVQALNDANVPSDSPLWKFKIASCVKLLGAYVATTAEEEKRTLEQHMLPKAAQHFDQLSKFPTSAQGFAYLKECVIPSMMYSTRVHHPDVSRGVAEYCDARAEHLVQSWARSQDFGLQQRVVLHASKRKGGLGLTSLVATASPAYACSVLADKSRGARFKAPKQRDIVQATQDLLAKKAAETLPGLNKHLEVLAQAGGGFFASTARRSSEEVASAALRLYLAIPSENAKLSTEPFIACSGCNSIATGRGAANLASLANARKIKLYTPLGYMHHSLGCAAMVGSEATGRHNSCNMWFARKLTDNGLVPVVEPKNMAVYDCPCGMKALEHDVYVAHKKTCDKAIENPRRHGIDLAFTDTSGTLIAIDVRICNELSETHCNKPIEAVFAEAAQEKARKYPYLCSRAGATLITICVSALGTLSTTTKSLIKTLVSANPALNYAEMCKDLSALVVAGTARALVVAERQAAINPVARPVSVAYLKMIEAKFQVQLVPKDEPAPAVVATPTSQQLAHIIQLLAQLVPQASELPAITDAAEAIRVADAAEAARLAKEENPHSVDVNTRVQRLPSVSTQRAASTRARSVASAETAHAQRDSALAANAAARAYKVENEKRELALQTEQAFDALNAAKEGLDKAADKRQAEIDEIYAVDEQVNAEQRKLNEETLQNLREIRAHTKAVIETTEKLREGSAELDRSTKLAADMSHDIEVAQQRLSQSRENSRRNSIARENAFQDAHSRSREASKSLRASQQAIRNSVSSARENSRGHTKGSTAMLPAYDGPNENCHLGQHFRQQDQQELSPSASPSQQPPQYQPGYAPFYHQIMSDPDTYKYYAPAAYTYECPQFYQNNLPPRGSFASTSLHRRSVESSPTRSNAQQKIHYGSPEPCRMGIMAPKSTPNSSASLRGGGSHFN
jgi:hypothetical protein